MFTIDLVVFAPGDDELGKGFVLKPARPHIVTLPNH